LVRFMETTQAELSPRLLSVNKSAIRSLEEWVDRVRVMQHWELLTFSHLLRGIFNGCNNLDVTGASAEVA
jgi:hypothetical protein